MPCIRRTILLAVLLGSAAMSRPSVAEEAACTAGVCQPAAGPRLYCPDDYCSKPLPWLTCGRVCFGPDCYCSKPLPWLRPPGPFCCNGSYCPKPLPKLGWPCVDAEYSCGVPPAAAWQPPQPGSGKK